MKEILASWIVFQLLVIGFTMGNVINSCLRGEYVQKELTKEDAGFGVILISVAVPLVWFATDIEKDENGCPK